MLLAWDSCSFDVTIMYIQLQLDYRQTRCGAMLHSPYVRVQHHMHAACPPKSVSERQSLMSKFPLRLCTSFHTRFGDRERCAE